MTETSLIEVGPLHRALAEAIAAGDMTALKDIRSMATALQQGAKARGMGIEAENQAAEVVIRAEREMGKLLTAMREAGLISNGNPHLRGTEVVTTEQLVGFSARDRRAGQWMLLGKMPDDRFEDLLSYARSTERLAKVDFYRNAKTPEQERAKLEKELGEVSRTDPAYNLFRKGAHMLLGFSVNEDGEDVFDTEGGSIRRLAEDELRGVAQLIRALANAYNEEKARRGA